MELRPLKKSIQMFIKMFTYLLIGDILLCFMAEDYPLMISSIILICGILASKILFNYDKYEQGITFLAFLFYVIGFYHVLTLGNYHTCYFILLVVPIIASILLESLYIKVFLIISSTLLFLLCNYLLGFPLFANYFFFYGLFPSTALMIHFYNRLMELAVEKNQLIQELKEKNEEMLLFSNMMSHDLKTPLRNIDGFSQLLQKQLTGLTSEEIKFFSFITKGVHTLKKLIDDLLQYSKFSTGNYEFKTIKVEPLINKLLLNFNYDITDKKVKIVKSNLSTIHGHEESLTLVFQNLISNAIKYQPKEASHIPHIEIHQKRIGNKNIILVEDNGIGIDSSKFKEVFMPFKRFHNTSEYEGTGLGMSIVNKVIEKHNGKIDIQSELGKGSTFSISLPVHGRTMNDE
ncbi:MAG: ATP-binding protein [Saprospiraceae bacterium]